MGLVVDPIGADWSWNIICQLNFPRSEGERMAEAAWGYSGEWVLGWLS